MDDDSKPARFDWVTLFWLKDGPRDRADRAGEFCRALDYFKSTAKSDEGDYDYYLSPGGDGRQTFHKLEVWGNLADLFAQVLSSQDWRSCTRLDFRRTLTARSDRDMKYFVLWAFRRGSKRVNMYPMDTRARRKSNKRDIGGKGLFLGSRKSDKTLAIYKRGKEMPACEVRFSGPECSARIELALEGVDFEQTPTSTPYICLQQRWWADMGERIKETTGIDDVETYINRAVAEWTEIERIIAAVNVAERLANGQLNFWDVMLKLGTSAVMGDGPGVCASCGEISPSWGEPCADCDPNPIIE